VPARNLVFLIDVSGSMASPDKLPLLKSGLELLVRQLRPEDRLAMVVYAGSSGLVLDSTSGDRQHEILAALERLSAGGSTHGSAGIELAYQVAQRNFTKGGINRVILATDGDFNVGTTNQSELQRLIERKRETGVFLTVLGFGRGNLQDSTMELLADKGNGNYAYIDSMREAQKVLVREAGSTLVTVAKDVKLQVEFNPARVASYRLVGYENRVLASRDFNDDTKDAGEMGAGHTVTALYEIVPKDSGAEPAGTTPEVDALRYQTPRALAPAGSTEEALTVKVRYKTPTGNRSEVASFPVPDRWVPISDTTEAFQWSAAVAGFAQWLRRSPFKGKATLAELRALAARAQGKDPHGDRRELVSLMDRAGDLAARFPSDGPPVSGSVAW
ncbi:MAG: DUF3520 domain-containing protein, partial [Myxococcales bacterium]|nr:DUF3520 domain-containing protein [Myxococcales bacterium]